jgi:hypothetical protein
MKKMKYMKKAGAMELRGQLRSETLAEGSKFGNEGTRRTGCGRRESIPMRESTGIWIEVLRLRSGVCAAEKESFPPRFAQDDGRGEP